MAANAGVGGGYTNVQRWKVNVQVRASMEPLIGDGAVKVTIGILRDVKNATLRQFCDVANYIETGHFPADFHTRPCAEVVETEDAENETPGWLITRPGFDPVCGVWGEVNGITLTVVSCDTMVQSLAAYMAMKEPLPDDLKPTQSPPTQPPARQSAPPAQPPEPEDVHQSDSGTWELGDYDNRDKERYAQQYGGQRVAFNVYKIAREYGKVRDGGPVTIYQLFANASHQWPAFRVYGDNEKSASMVAEMEQMTVNGDAVGKWRCVVYIRVKDGKARFYPVSLGADGHALEEQPF